MNEILYKSIEIVGIDSGDEGRVCGLHKMACGGALEEGTRLKLVKASVMVTRDGAMSK
jgi:hypothetical protein